jgi:L-lactate dehydrogenase complex protein LldE
MNEDDMAETAVSKQARHKPGDLYFFGTCLVDLFMPEAGLDAITLLEREGVRVHFPEAQS